MATIAVTALAVDDARLAALGATLGRYGLQAAGGVWQTTPEQVAGVDWRPMADAFIAQGAAFWLIAADDKALADPAVRYGLNLMASALRAALGADLPMAVLWPAAAGASRSALPALPSQLREALVFEATDAWAAKVVARVHRPRATGALRPDRLSVHGNAQLGQWFELVPGEGEWAGVVFAVAGEGASIDFQATGPSGGLPEKAVIAHGQSGLKLQSAGLDFTGWALRNAVGATPAGPVSYYARVRGRPQALLWMPYTEEDDAQATLLALD
jgi:hypothetical protein